MLTLEIGQRATKFVAEDFQPKSESVCHLLEAINAKDILLKRSVIQSPVKKAKTKVKFLIHWKC